MREPKRLAHRQAERNKARALKRWSWDDSDDDPAGACPLAPATHRDIAAELLLSSESPVYQT